MGDDRINSSVHDRCKADDELLYKGRSWGSWSCGARARAEAVNEGRMGKEKDQLTNGRETHGGMFL